VANVPSTRQPPPPNRFVLGYTIGTGMKILGGNSISALASSPNEGSVDTTPNRIVPLGNSPGSKTANIPQLAAGQQYTTTVTIPLPLVSGYTENQPPNGPGSTPKGPVVTRTQDQLLFQASMTVNNPIAGLSVVRFTAQPQARGKDSQIYNAATGTGSLPLGQPYTSFQVLCTVVLVASMATAAGVLTINTEGRLTRQAAGGAT
jgi:hypothetical protein